MLSHPHKTLFVHIPKCGGQSVETAFLNDLGLDWGTRSPLLLRRNGNPRLGPPRLAHLKANEYVKYHYASSEMFDSYYKFAVLRDPIDRMVSTFNYMGLKSEDGELLQWDAFLYQWLPRKIQSSNFFVAPQREYICDTDGSVLVDDVFWLENLSDAFETIKRRSNLESDLPHVNSSEKRMKRADLSQKDSDFISDLYSGDLDFIEDLGLRASGKPTRVEA
ncbi:MAG TPA: sulfotransferase family 2 domain-containing protein [Tichowtungia sp.]|nr:sulfotransferase family 2 domain-containing protein [Tichowtungia sp.]